MGIQYDPTKAEPRNASEGGKTAQEIADQKAGGGGNPPHPSAASGVPIVPTKPVGPNVHPVAKGVYGAPVSAPILGPRNGT